MLNKWSTGSAARGYRNGVKGMAQRVPKSKNTNRFLKPFPEQSKSHDRQRRCDMNMIEFKHYLHAWKFSEVALGLKRRLKVWLEARCTLNVPEREIDISNMMT